MTGGPSTQTTKPSHTCEKVNSLIFPGLQGGPLMHVIAAKAVAFREALQPEFTVYQQWSGFWKTWPNSLELEKNRGKH